MVVSRTDWCKEAPVSNEYYDLILARDSVTYYREQIDCSITVNEAFDITYWERSALPQLNYNDYTYSAIPKCYALMDTQAMLASGITQIKAQPTLSLTGAGVLLGFVDTGIDYTNPVFLDEGGQTRILSIWDMTQDDAAAPSGYLFGSEYDSTQIQEAIDSDDPYAIVPSRDTDGHGTFLASLAAGQTVRLSGFSGAAPGASIAVVKLKEAKQYLRDFYSISKTARVYQENDIMLAVSYLNEIARQKKMPLVICLGLGTSQGDHRGNSALDLYLDALSLKYGYAVVTCTGNEAASRHHFQGEISTKEEYEEAEIRVDDGERGFLAELWGSATASYTVEIVSPSGEVVPRLPFRRGANAVYTFLFEDSVVSVDYQTVETRSGAELVLMRFERPAAGIWKIRVYGSDGLENGYNIWLPVEEFLSAQTYFLRPAPDFTLTGPGYAKGVITVGGYSVETNSLYLQSGRGGKIIGSVKPDFCAPAVDVNGADLLREPDGSVRFTLKSGTSIAAAITAGAAALYYEWAVVQQKEPVTNGISVRTALIRGCDRRDDLLYPNAEWGYGTLNLYGTFLSLRSE
jgi:subtilisin family serine protease